jgi:hypothetical protein
MGEKLDVEIAATPMPEPYQNKMVDSLFLFSFSTTIKTIFKDLQVYQIFPGR